MDMQLVLPSRTRLYPVSICKLTLLGPLTVPCGKNVKLHKIWQAIAVALERDWQALVDHEAGAFLSSRLLKSSDLRPALYDSDYNYHFTAASE